MATRFGTNSKGLRNFNNKINHCNCHWGFNICPSHINNRRTVIAKFETLSNLFSAVYHNNVGLERKIIDCMNRSVNNNLIYDQTSKSTLSGNVLRKMENVFDSKGNLRCTYCGGRHGFKICRQRQKKCFHCHSLEHYIAACPQLTVNLTNRTFRANNTPMLIKNNQGILNVTKTDKVIIKNLASSNKVDNSSLHTNKISEKYESNINLKLSPKMESKIKLKLSSPTKSSTIKVTDNKLNSQAINNIKVHVISPGIIKTNTGIVQTEFRPDYFKFECDSQKTLTSDKTENFHSTLTANSAKDLDVLAELKALNANNSIEINLEKNKTLTLSKNKINKYLSQIVNKCNDSDILLNSNTVDVNSGFNLLNAANASSEFLNIADSSQLKLTSTIDNMVKSDKSSKLNIVENNGSLKEDTFNKLALCNLIEDKVDISLCEPTKLLDIMSCSKAVNLKFISDSLVNGMFIGDIINEILDSIKYKCIDVINDKRLSSKLAVNNPIQLVKLCEVQNNIADDKIVTNSKLTNKLNLITVSLGSFEQFFSCSSNKYENLMNINYFAKKSNNVVIDRLISEIYKINFKTGTIEQSLKLDIAKNCTCYATFDFKTDLKLDDRSIPWNVNTYANVSVNNKIKPVSLDIIPILIKNKDKNTIVAQKENNYPISVKSKVQLNVKVKSTKLVQNKNASTFSKNKITTVTPDKSPMLNKKKDEIPKVQKNKNSPIPVKNIKSGELININQAKMEVFLFHDYTYENPLMIGRVNIMEGSKNGLEFCWQWDGNKEEDIFKCLCVYMKNGGDLDWNVMLKIPNMKEFKRFYDELYKYTIKLHNNLAFNEWHINDLMMKAFTIRENKTIVLVNGGCVTVFNNKEKEGIDIIYLSVDEYDQTLWKLVDSDDKCTGLVENKIVSLELEKNESISLNSLKNNIQPVVPATNSSKISATDKSSVLGKNKAKSDKVKVYAKFGDKSFLKDINSTTRILDVKLISAWDCNRGNKMFNFFECLWVYKNYATTKGLLPSCFPENIDYSKEYGWLLNQAIILNNDFNFWDDEEEVLGMMKAFAYLEKVTVYYIKFKNRKAVVINSDNDIVKKVYIMGNEDESFSLMKDATQEVIVKTDNPLFNISPGTL